MALMNSANTGVKEGRKWFISRRTQHILFYGYMASDIWLRTIQIAREETRCRHYIVYSFGLAARDRVYAHTTAFVTPVVDHWLGRPVVISEIDLCNTLY